MTDDNDPTVSEHVDDGPVHAIKAALAWLIADTLGYVIAILVMLPGAWFAVSIMDWNVWFAWFLGFVLAIAIGSFLLRIMPLSEDQIRTGLFGIPSVEDTLKRRGQWADLRHTSDRAETALRQRLIDMGVRSKDDPPPRSGASTPPRDPDQRP